MKFTATTRDDIDQIREWINADPFHQIMAPEWWLTGEGTLSFCLQDDTGPICFLRFDDEDGLLRMNTQFGPEEEVSKKRLITAILNQFPPFIERIKAQHFKGIVFESTSENLINFMKKIGFKNLSGDDYVLMFEEVCDLRTI